MIIARLPAMNKGISCSKLTRLTRLIIALCFVLLTGCGGGGGSEYSRVGSESVSTSALVSGNAVKGVLRNAQVRAYRLLPTGVDRSRVLASAITDNEGSYSLSMPDFFVGDYIIEVYPGEDTWMKCDITAGCGSFISHSGRDVSAQDLNSNGEVDFAEWFPLEEPTFTLRSAGSVDVIGDTLDRPVHPLSDLAASLLIANPSDYTVSAAEARVERTFGLATGALSMPAVDITEETQLQNSSSDQVRVGLLSSSLWLASTETEQEAHVAAYSAIRSDFATRGGSLQFNNRNSSVVTMERLRESVEQQIDGINRSMGSGRVPDEVVAENAQLLTVARSAAEGQRTGGALFAESAETFFNDEVWGVLDPACMTCHANGGVAAQTRLLMQRGASGPSFSAVRNLVLVDRRILLTKPFGENHGGGAVLGPEHRDTLQGLVDRIVYEASNGNSDTSNTPPIAVIDSFDTVGIVPYLTVLNGENSTDDGVITQYEWTIQPEGGEAETLSGAIQNYTFRRLGRYTVTLRVTDDMNASHATSLQVQVNSPDVDQPPVADASATSPVSGRAPLAVALNGSQSADDNGINLYEWQLPGGVTLQGENVMYTFNDPGNYPVSLTVRDTMGQTTSTSLEIHVTGNDGPTAAITPVENQVISVGELVEFSSTGSADDEGIASYLWDFGDGDNANTAVVSHAWTASGSFTVQLTVTDRDGLVDVVQRQVEVVALPTADVSATNPISGPGPLMVQLDASRSLAASGQNLSSYVWTLDAVEIASGITGEFEVADAGSYQLELRVTDSLGAVDTDQLAVTVVDNVAPTAVMTASASAGAAPLLIRFDATASSDDFGITNFNWDFGDGNVGTGGVVNHTFTEVGTYTVRLTVVDDQGLLDSTTQMIEVGVDNPPVAQFTANVTSGVAPLTVNFDALESTDDQGIETYAWDFGDGAQGAGVSVNHTFTEGVFDVVLTVTDTAGISDTRTLSISATSGDTSGNQPPVADASLTQNLTGNGPLTVNFDASASTDDQGITSYQWTFGDGQQSSQSIVDHTYSTPGTYMAQLQVTDAEGLTNTAVVAVNVMSVNEAPVAGITGSGPFAGQAPLNVQFNGATSTDDGGIADYSWRLNGTTVRQGAVANYTFGSAGTYPVTLLVTDDEGLQSEASFTVEVSPANQTPDANIGLTSGTTGRAPLSVNFNALASSDDGGAGNLSYQWVFGDGSTGSGAQVVHTYTEGGVYQARVTVTDSAGLSDSANVTVNVTENTAPIADAGLSAPLSGAAPLMVQFDGTRSADDVSVTSYQWDFGDGSMGSGSRVGHQYTQPGTYNAELVVVDDEGLASVVDRRTVVVGENLAPVARITLVSGEYSGQAPLTLRVNASSSTDPEGDDLTYRWLFGDSSGALTTFETSHSYTTAGQYTLSLTVEDTQGNTNTVTQVVNVQSGFEVAEAYNTQCAACHGVNGEGASAPALTGAATLESLVADVNRMPPGGSLDCQGQADCDVLMAQFVLDNFASAPSDVGFQCEASAPLVAKNIRRLSKLQYTNTLRDLLSIRLGTGAADAVMSSVQSAIDAIPNDQVDHDFDILDDRMSATHIERYFAAGVAVADTIAASDAYRNALIGGCSANASDTSCRAAFVDWFGLRTHRRPLDVDARSAYQSISDYRTLIALMLNAPEFLYHAEISGEPVSGEVYSLDDFAVAARLSYHFWQSMPDETLLADAQAGRLTTQFAAVAERVFNDSRTQQGLANFYLQWLHTDRLADPNSTNHPAYEDFLQFDYGNGTSLSPSTDVINYAAAAQREIEDLTHYYTWQSSGAFSDLFTSIRSFASDPDLARAYGVSTWTRGNWSAMPSFPQGQRSGVLTRAATQIYGSINTRPILKGVRIRRDLLCEDLVLPADNNAPPEANVDPQSSTRDRTVATTEIEGTACAGCHVEDINPLGFPTEEYDSLGRHRTLEAVFDPNGNLISTPMVDTATQPQVEVGQSQSVSGGVQLSDMIGNSDRAKACFAQKYFRFTFARMEQESNDGCALQNLYNATQTGTLRDTLRAVANEPQFRQRRIVQ